MTKVPAMKVKSSTGKLNRFDMSSSLITTSNFGVMKPIKMITCIPGDKINLNVSEFTRLMPMPAPTFGSIKSKTRAFFVPFRLLFSDWLPFISNNRDVRRNVVNSPSSAPQIDLSRLVKAFIYQSDPSKKLTTIVSTDDYDFVNPSYVSSTVTRYKFTPYGKRVFDWFCSVGFPIPFSKKQSEWVGNFSFSIAPYLAFCKLYIDWVVPSRFVYNYKALISILRDYPASEITSYLTTVKNLFELLTAFYSFYDDDYFTSAFVNATGTEVQMATSTIIPPSDGVPDSYNGPDWGAVSGNQSNDPHFQSTDSPETYNNGATINQSSSTLINDKEQTTPVVAPITYFGIRTLGALQDMVNRGKLAGTKVQEYLRITYGFSPSADAMNLSTYLGCKESEIMIGDVMSMAGTDLNALGQYAGRGIGSGNASFNYECKEHGIFFVTNEVCVNPSYVDGLDFAFEQTDRLDFYQPEIDNIGCEAIPVRRLALKYNEGNNPSLSEVFGFTPRYSAYKFAFDRVSGDFRIPTLNTGLDSWYLSRTFNKDNSQAWRYISEKFCQNTSDNSMNNLDRIFSDVSNTSDHFYSIFRLNCSMLRPMLPFSEALETYHHNELGKEVKTSINGGIAR